MSTRAGDALHVQAQGGAVQSLYERGLTWVSFKPMPNLACGIDFALRKFPDLGLLSGVVQGVRHEHARQDSGDGDDDFSFHMNLAGSASLRGAVARRRCAMAMPCCSAIRFRAPSADQSRRPSRHPASARVARSARAQYR